MRDKQNADLQNLKGIRHFEDQLSFLGHRSHPWIQFSSELHGRVCMCWKELHFPSRRSNQDEAVRCRCTVIERSYLPWSMSNGPRKQKQSTSISRLLLPYLFPPPIAMPTNS